MTAETARITVIYEGGLSVLSDWRKSSIFCPDCGEQEVWTEEGGGDYYQGPSHICTACSFGFTMPSGRLHDDPQDQQLVEQLKAAQ